MTGRGKADCLSNLGNSKLEEEREGGENTRKMPSSSGNFSGATTNKRKSYRLSVCIPRVFRTLREHLLRENSPVGVYMTSSRVNLVEKARRRDTFYEKMELLLLKTLSFFLDRIV